MGKSFSLTNLSLRRRVWISVALVSLIPVIVLSYYFYGFYVSLWAISVLFLVIFLGWKVVFEVVTSIVRIYSRSRRALNSIGEQAPEVTNEVQSIEAVINILSNKVKGSFEQLKEFSEKTEELNREVSKKVLTLSIILQANDLFSKNTPAEEVVEFLNSRLKDLLGLSLSICILKEGQTGKLKLVSFAGTSLDKADSLARDLQDEILALQRTMVLYGFKRPDKDSIWLKKVTTKNLIVIPIVSKGKSTGVILAGNEKDGFSFSEDELEVLNLFSQNVTIMWERERLTLKINELEIVDSLTGLYNKKAIIQKLDEEIRRATMYQRPCGFVFIEIIDYFAYQEKIGIIEAEKILKKIAKIFKENLRVVDIAGRIDPNTLGAILIESNKRQLRKTLDTLKVSLAQVASGKVRLAFSFAESPIDGVTSKELIEFAQANKDIQE